VVVGSWDVDRRIPLLLRLVDEFDITVVGSRVALASSFHPVGIGYEHYAYNPGFSLLADLRSLLQVRTFLLRLQPDIAHAFDTKPCIFARLAARAAKVPVRVGTLPGLGGLWADESWQTRRRRLVIRRLQQLASACSTTTVFQNQDDRAQLDREGVVPLHKSMVIAGSGVDAVRFDPARIGRQARARVRAALGIGEHSPVVLYIGRMLKSKGVGDLATAMELVRRRLPDAVCLLVGERVAQHHGGLTEREWCQVCESCRWLGARDDVPELLAASDVFVYPTCYREGVPRVLVEAALMGVPLVCTDTIGCREVVEQRRTGLLIPCRDPVQLARACLELVRDHQLAHELGMAARQHCLKNHELTVVAEQYRCLYHRLLAEEPAHG